MCDDCRDLESIIYELEKSNKRLYHMIDCWRREFRTYASHKEDCPVTEMAQTGRLTKVECTCCFNSVLEFTQTKKE